MKRFSISVVILALACMAMSGVASGASTGANDRTYYPTIDPGSAVPNTPQNYVLTVENYSQNLCTTCTPLHFIQMIRIYVPDGFILVDIPGSIPSSPNSPPTGWTAQVSNTVPPVVTLTTGLTNLIVASSVGITIRAQYNGNLASCKDTKKTTWKMDVNQSATGGVGNAYALAPNRSFPVVTIGNSVCVTDRKSA